jgi:hypothetical protein
MRRPTSRMSTHTRNRPTPIEYTSSASPGAASRPVERKNIAPAAVAAHAGQPACRK